VPYVALLLAAEVEAEVASSLSALLKGWRSTSYHSLGLQQSPTQEVVLGLEEAVEEHRRDVLRCSIVGGGDPS